MRAVVTVNGEDKKGIIAQVTTTLWKNDANILDITQKVLQGSLFTMIAVVELGETNFTKLDEAMQETAKATGTKILVMHEDIFNSMHRI